MLSELSMASKKINICIVTTSRADYGLMFHVLKKVKSEKKFCLQLIISGTHPEKEYGNTVDFINEDGFVPARIIKILDKSGGHASIGLTSSNAVKEFTKAFTELKPDAVLMLGDRYEMLAAAFAAAICVIPAVHFHGGEISEGANDDMFRHAITKLSSLHFTSTQEYRNRVIQMGEQPSRVFVSGALGIESIKNLRLLSKIQIQKKLGITFKKRIFLITFHPATMEKNSPVEQVQNLLQAISEFKDTTFVITKANADAHGELINGELEKFASTNENCYLSASLGQINYLSVMSFCDVVIGNSSSGIIEAPSFYKPVVNIGSRQNRRIKAKCIIDCKTDKKSIVSSIKKALGLIGKIHSTNPYEGKKLPSEIIMNVLRKTDFGKLLPKKFYDKK